MSRMPLRNLFFSNLTPTGNVITFLNFFLDPVSVAEIANSCFSRSMRIFSSVIPGSLAMTRRDLPSSMRIVTGSAVSSDAVSFLSHCTMIWKSFVVCPWQIHFMCLVTRSGNYPSPPWSHPSVLLYPQYILSDPYKAEQGIFLTSVISLLCGGTPNKTQWVPYMKYISGFFIISIKN